MAGIKNDGLASALGLTGDKESKKKKRKLMSRVANEANNKFDKTVAGAVRSAVNGAKRGGRFLVHRATGVKLPEKKPPQSLAEALPPGSIQIIPPENDDLYLPYRTHMKIMELLCENPDNQCTFDKKEYNKIPPAPPSSQQILDDMEIQWKKNPPF